MSFNIVLFAIAGIPLLACLLLVARNIGGGPRRRAQSRRAKKTSRTTYQKRSADAGVLETIGQISAGPGFVELSSRDQRDGPARDAENIRGYFRKNM